MTIRDSVACRASAAGERHTHRARFWRMAIGIVGLSWVGVLLMLMS
jgi:hypothetical protein